MRIPFLTAAKERKLTEHYAQIELKRAETALVDKKIQHYNTMVNAGNELTKAITETVSKPTMSLNSELYSGTSGYQNPSTFSDHKKIKHISRVAYWQSPPAQAMLGRFVDMVHGPYLDLQSMPKWNLIPSFDDINFMTDEKKETEIKKRQAIVKNIESRWDLWARSIKSDYCMKDNFNKRSRNRFFDLLFHGEYIEVLRYSQSRKRNPLTIQNISPDDLVRIDSRVAPGNTEKDGIEYNSKSQPVAYHIYNHNTGKSERVARIGAKSGRVMVIHNTIGNGHRGEPLLTGVISEITKLADFQALEIQASVINALFAVWVETEQGGDPKKIATSEGIGGIGSNCDDIESRLYDTKPYNVDLKSAGISQGGIIAQPGVGQKLNSFDTKRPTANFKEFFNTVLTDLYAAKGMSRAVAQYDFNGSYSAARGELLVFWNRVLTLRYDHVTDYENVIYQMWMWGEIDNDRIPEFKNGWYARDEEIRESMSTASWTGPQRPDIDPMRSAKAHEIESENLWKTDQKISAERGGGDYDENAQRKISENKIKAEANRPLVELEKTTYSNSKTESVSENKTIEG